MVNRFNYLKLAKVSAEAVDAKKAEDIVILDTRKESDIADFLVIAGAGSSAQMRALDDAVQESLLELGARILHREGRARDRWIVLDYGGLVVHILLAEARQFYRLESLWEKAKRVKWNQK